MKCKKTWVLLEDQMKRPIGPLQRTVGVGDKMPSLSSHSSFGTSKMRYLSFSTTKVAYLTDQLSMAFLIAVCAHTHILADEDLSKETASGRLRHALVEIAPACHQMGVDRHPHLRCANLKAGFTAVKAKLRSASLCDAVVPHKKRNMEATDNWHLKECGRRGEEDQDRLRHETLRFTYPDDTVTTEQPNGRVLSPSMANQWVAPAELAQRASGNYMCSLKRDNIICYIPQAL